MTPFKTAVTMLIQDLASLRVIAESGNQTEEDRDMLATLEEALEGLTKDRLVQVGNKSQSHSYSEPYQS